MIEIRGSRLPAEDLVALVHAATGRGDDARIIDAVQDQGARALQARWPKGDIRELTSNAPAAARMPFTLRADHRYALGDLVRLDGVEFVDAAYRAILGRAPDEPGLDHHLELLGSGVSKAQVLAGLVRDPAAQTVGARVEGLARARFVERAVAMPVLGRLVALVQFVANARYWMQRIRRLEADLARVSHALRESQDALATTSDANFRLINARLDALRENRRL